MMSLIKRSYKYRMYPNKTQEELLAKTFGCVRVVWNACVDSFNSYDKETNPNPKFPTKSDLVIEKPWLNEVSAATLQQKQRRLHRDIANKRSWYMHNLTTMLVNNYDVICIENLNASGMLQNHKLAGSVYDASFSMFRNQLEYKCRWYGKELIVIDRFYPSSKTCSRCGWKNKDLKLSDRTFVCKDCGMEIDRDLNAAINIQAVGVDAAIRTQSSRVASCVEASKME